MQFGLNTVTASEKGTVMTLLIGTFADEETLALAQSEEEGRGKRATGGPRTFEPEGIWSQT